MRHFSDGHGDGTVRFLPWYRQRWVHLVVALVVAAVAFAALHSLAREVTWAQLATALATTPRGDILLAILLTAVSFTALGFYDVLAVRSVAPGRITHRVAMLAGAGGYAVSNTLGFALLTGGALRAQIYGANGLDTQTVARIIAATWMTFLMGIGVAAGIILLLDPTGPAARLELSPTLDRIVGAAMLIGVAAFFAWIGTGARTLTVRGRKVAFPSLPLALAQTCIALLDVAAAATVLWLLMPASVAVGPATFFVAYLAALLIGIASHAPGGLGAFEATIIATLGLDGQADVVAALILFRLIYYILPFSIAALGIALIWSRGRRAGGTGKAAAVADALAPIVPPLLAGVALLAGLMLLVSGAIPVPRSDAETLRALSTPAVTEAAHLIGAVLGVGLIVLAHSLMLRRRRAWRLATGALAVGAVASLLKGVDWQEALVLLACMSVLLVFRPMFHRDGSALRATPEWLVWAAFALATSLWFGLLAYRGLTAGDVLAWGGDGARFLRGTLAAAFALIVLTLASSRRWRGGAPQAQDT